MVLLYAHLVGEFEPCVDFRPHSIAKGPHKGKEIKKQKWSKCALSTHILINLELFPHPFLSLLCYAFCTSNTYHCIEHKYSDNDLQWHTKIKKENHRDLVGNVGYVVSAKSSQKSVGLTCRRRVGDMSGPMLATCGLS